MTNGINALALRGRTPAVGSLGIGRFDPSIAQNALLTGQREQRAQETNALNRARVQQQMQLAQSAEARAQTQAERQAAAAGLQSRLTNLKISEAERTRNEAMLDDLTANVLGATSEVDFNTRRDAFARRRGIDPTTLTGVTFDQLPALRNEAEGAKAILARTRQQTTGAAPGLTAAQRGRFNALVQAGVSPARANLIVGGAVRPEDLPFTVEPTTSVPTPVATPAPVVTPTPTPPPAAVTPAPVTTAAQTEPPLSPRGQRIQEEETVRQRARTAAKRPEQFRKARLAMSNLDRSNTVVQNAVKTATDIIRRNERSFLGIPINTAAGFGSVLSNLPQSDARALRNALSTIRANIGFDTLGEIKAASPTGGALGSVTERELSLLQATQGNLDQAQNPDDLINVLTEIAKIRRESGNARQAAFNQDFRDLLGQQPAQTRVVTPAPVTETPAPVTDIGETDQGTLRTFSTQAAALEALRGGSIDFDQPIMIGGRRATFRR